MKNVLFICIDCLRNDYLYKNKQLTNLNKLINKSIYFTTAISTTTTTSPSIASVLTGLYPYQHGILSLSGYKLYDTVKTFPEYLKEAGYTTHAFVTGPLHENFGLNKGFDTYEYRDVNQTLDTPWKDDLIANLSNLKNPWFTFLHLWELHGPRYVSKEHTNILGLNKYKNALHSLDDNIGDVFDSIDFTNTIVVLFGDHGESIADSPTKKLLSILHKNSKTRNLAKFYGRQLDRIRKHIPFGIQDHYRPGFHGRFEGHGYGVYDYLVRIPLTIYIPNQNYNNNISKQVSQVDITPTILDLLSIKCQTIENHVPEYGRSLCNLINNPKYNWEELAYIYACGQSLKNKANWLAGLRTPKWKFAKKIYQQNNPKYELYNIQKDNLELHNQQEKYPDLISKFDYKIDNLINLTKDNHTNVSEDEALNRKLKDLGYI